MKFAHIADCHVGGWRDPKLKNLTIDAFDKAIDQSIEKQVDFILISGDLFNSSIPDVSLLKRVVKKLKHVNKKQIPVYIIAGSHDFSPSGKTMLDVLEEAGLCINVVKGEVVENKLRLKFTVDEKTGAKITGMIGKKGMLEKKFYENLDTKNLEQEAGFKIFMFHSALTELKPKELEKMDSSPVSYLPKGFNYYAGGHVHIVKDVSLEGYKNIVYPGPVFPNNFSELEKLEKGGFFFYEDGKTSFNPIQVKNVFSLRINANNKTPEQINQEIIDEIKNKEFIDTIVLLRILGKLETGKTTDIDFKRIYSMLYNKSAFFVMKNTYSLKTKEFDDIKIMHSEIDEIEDTLIDEQANGENIESWDLKKEKSMIRQLMTSFNLDKKEGEKVYEYQERILKEAAKLLDIEL
ncbi:serine/threonine protein phosphatase [Candidatus Woesearchaeota archaeon]|nr:serine/threonine protein phosphatase [Candidatus Woesearchaeota archaeon]